MFFKKKIKSYILSFKLFVFLQNVFDPMLKCNSSAIVFTEWWQVVLCKSPSRAKGFSFWHILSTHVIEQWRLTHDVSIYNGHYWGAVTSTLVAERLAVKLSVLFLRFLRFEYPTFDMKDEHWNRLYHLGASKLLSTRPFWHDCYVFFVKFGREIS